MSEEDLIDEIEEVEKLEGVSETLKKVVKKLDELERRIESLEDNRKTKVRVVDTDKGKRIVLEDRNQTWFSPNYFRKILDNLDD